MAEEKKGGVSVYISPEIVADSSLNQQHMLPERRNGDMLNQPSTPQPDTWHYYAQQLFGGRPDPNLLFKFETQEVEPDRYFSWLWSGLQLRHVEGYVSLSSWME